MRADTINNCKILIGCFVVELLISGACRLSSIYFVESITRYDVNRNQASFPFVLTYMMKNFSGPLVGYVEQIFGTKWIITIGSVVATLSIGGCFFAEDILIITLLWGVVLGVSYGFAHNMQAPLLNHHFIKGKSKANAIVSSGNSVGGVLLPAITTACIQSFGTSGSFLVLSAVIAHAIPASLLIQYSTIKPTCNAQKESGDVRNANNKNNAEISNNDHKNDKNIAEISNNDHKNDKNIAEISNTTDDLSMVRTYENPQKRVVGDISSKGLIISDSLLNNYRENAINHTKVLTTYDSNALNKEQKDNVNETGFVLHKEQSGIAITKKESENVNKSYFNKRNFTLRYFRVFRDPPFLALLFINGISSTIIIVLWTVILDFVRDKEVPNSLEIYYVILFPITDLFGRNGSGYFLDKGILTVANFSLINFLVQAVFLVIIIYANNYILVMVCEMLISVCIGTTIILGIALTHEFVEEDSRKMAMSSRFILYGPLSFTISPMIGYFRGGFGSYDNIFHILSAASLLCGFLSFLLPNLGKRRRPTIPPNIS